MDVVLLDMNYSTGATSSKVGLYWLKQIRQVSPDTFLERTNRDISSFLEAIKHSDFTQRFAAEGANSSFLDLYASFNQISESFQRVKTEKQAHYHYLQTIVEHPVKVRELLQNVRQLLQPTMQRQHISLSLYLPDENMTILADAEQLEQVL